MKGKDNEITGLKKKRGRPVTLKPEDRRTILLHVKLSPNEMATLKADMEAAGETNKSAYVRWMCRL